MRVKVLQLPFVIKISVLSIFEWPFSTGFTVFKEQRTDEPKSMVDTNNVYQDQTDRAWRFIRVLPFKLSKHIIIGKVLMPLRSHSQQ